MTVSERMVSQVCSTILSNTATNVNNIPDQRVQQDQFAYGKVDPTEAGKKGGETGGSSSDDTSSSDNSSSGGKGQFAGGKVSTSTNYLRSLANFSSGRPC